MKEIKFCKVLKLIIKKKIYSATASGTCLNTNGISNESLQQYRMITLPHSVMCHDFSESQQAVTVHLILTLTVLISEF